MTETSTTAASRHERRLRSAGYLQSLGVERTTAALAIGVAILMFAFFSIVGSEGPATTEPEPEPATPAQTLAES